MNNSRSNKLDQFLFVIVTYSFIFYVYQLPILYAIDDFVSKIVPMSFAGLLLRVSLVLFLMKILLGKQSVRINREVILVIFISIGVTISLSLAQVNDLSSYNLALSSNTIYLNPKVLIRYFFLFFVLTNILKREKEIHNFLKILYYTGLFIMITGLLLPELTTSSSNMGDGFKIDSTGVLNYNYVTYGVLDKNYFAILIGITLVITLYFLKNNVLKIRYIKYLLWFSLILSIYFLIKAMSLGAIITTLIGVIVFNFQNIKLSKFPLYFFYFTALTIVLIIILPKYYIDILIIRFGYSFETLIPILSGNILDTGFSRTSTSSQRIGLAISAFEHFKESPIFGFGGTKDTFSRTLFTGSHTDYINWLVQYGLVTFLPIIVFMYTIFRKTISNLIIFRKLANRLNLEVTLSLSIMVMLLFNSLFSPVFLLYFAFSGLFIRIYYVFKPKCFINES